MVLGHFALGAASKPLAPEVPIWALMIAPQAMDVFFVPMVGLGLESLAGSGYGQGVIHAYYTHSIVGALVIAAIMFAIGKAAWKTQRAAWTLALLSASHWVLDVITHRPDMPILPGNIGNLPLLGLGLWNYPWISLTVEIILAVIGIAIYFRWASQQTPRPSRWYWGPAITALLFIVIVLADLPTVPPA